MSVGGSFSVHQVTIDLTCHSPRLAGDRVGRGWGLTQTQPSGDVSPLFIPVSLSGSFLICPWVSLSRAISQTRALVGLRQLPRWGYRCRDQCAHGLTPYYNPGVASGEPCVSRGRGPSLSSFWSTGGEGQPHMGRPLLPQTVGGEHTAKSVPDTLWCGTPSFFSLSLSPWSLRHNTQQTHTSCGRGVGLGDRPVVGQTNRARCPDGHH